MGIIGIDTTKKKLRIGRLIKKPSKKIDYWKHIY